MLNIEAMAERPGAVTPEQDAPHGRIKKIQTILKLFLTGTTLNRFEAEWYHDHCLHSTVSSLEAYGIRFDRHWESVPCLGGRATVRCKRYWINPMPENIATAQSLADLWERL